MIQNRVARAYLDDLKLTKKFPALCLDEDKPEYIVVWETSGFRMMVNQLQPIASETKISGQVGNEPVRMSEKSVTWVPIDVPKDTFIENFDVYKVDRSGCLIAPAVFGIDEYGGNPEKAAKKALKKALEYLSNPTKAPAQTTILCFPPERIGAVKPTM
jgi:hypothetical protein